MNESIGDTKEMIIAMSYAVVFILTIVEIFGKWLIFNKFGEKGWKSIIPFYNDYIFYKFTWNLKFFWIMLPFPIVWNLSSYVLSHEELLFGHNELIISLELLFIIALIGIGIFRIIQLIKLSKCFGKGIPFALGLIFFEPVFDIILGFGKSKYVGYLKKESQESHRS